MSAKYKHLKVFGVNQSLCRIIDYLEKGSVHKVDGNNAAVHGD